MQETIITKAMNLKLLEDAVRDANSQGFEVVGAPFQDRDRQQWCWAMKRETSDTLRGVDRKRK